MEMASHREFLDLCLGAAPRPRRRRAGRRVRPLQRDRVDRGARPDWSVVVLMSNGGRRRAVLRHRAARTPTFTDATGAIPGTITTDAAGSAGVPLPGARGVDLGQRAEGRTPMSPVDRARRCWPTSVLGTAAAQLPGPGSHEPHGEDRQREDLVAGAVHQVQQQQECDDRDQALRAPATSTSPGAGSSSGDDIRSPTLDTAGWIIAHGPRRPPLDREVSAPDRRGPAGRRRSRWPSGERARTSVGPRSGSCGSPGRGRTAATGAPPGPARREPRSRSRPTGRARPRGCRSSRSSVVRSL